VAIFHGQTVDVHEDFENALDGSWVETDTDNNIDVNDAAAKYAGTNGMSLDYYGDNAGVEKAHIRYNMGAERTDLSVGWWWYSGAMSSFSGSADIANWAGATTGTTNLRVYYHKAGGSTYEVDIRGTGYSANRKAISVNTWYWLTLDLNKNGTCTLRVYNTSGAEVDAGTSVTATANNGVCQYFYLGFTGTPTDEEGVIYYDDFVADWADATFPLLGWTVAGGNAPTAVLSGSLAGPFGGPF